MDGLMGRWEDVWMVTHHASGNLTPGSTLYENGGLVGDMM